MAIQADETAIEDQDVNQDQDENHEEQLDDSQNEPDEDVQNDSDETDDSINSEDDEDETEDNTDESEDIVVSIGEDSLPSKDEDKRAPDWIRNTRKINRKLKEQLREKESKLRELDEKLSALQGVKPAEELGPRPKYDDFEYDSDKYEAALSDWITKKQEHEEKSKAEKAKLEAENAAWLQKLDAHNEAKKQIKASNIEDAEFALDESLTPQQRMIIIHVSDNSPMVEYALGTNQKELEKISKITDPTKFAFAVAKLETRMKVSNTVKKPKTSPEKRIVSSGTTTGSQSHLDKLRAEAEKTNDYSKVMEYRAKMRSNKNA